MVGIEVRVGEATKAGTKPEDRTTIGKIKDKTTIGKIKDSTTFYKLLVS